MCVRWCCCGSSSSCWARRKPPRVTASRVGESRLERSFYLNVCEVLFWKRLYFFIFRIFFKIIFRNFQTFLFPKNVFLFCYFFFPFFASHDVLLVIDYFSHQLVRHSLLLLHHDDDDDDDDDDDEEDDDDDDDDGDDDDGDGNEYDGGGDYYDDDV